MRICAVVILEYFASESWRQSDWFFVISFLVQLNKKHIKSSEKDKKRMMNHAHTWQRKCSFWLEVFTWPVLCCWKSWSWHSMIENKGIPKEISYNFVVRNLKIFMEHIKVSHFFQLVITLCSLQFFCGRYNLSKYHEKPGICTPSSSFFSVSFPINWNE